MIPLSHLCYLTSSWHWCNVAASSARIWIVPIRCSCSWTLSKLMVGKDWRSMKTFLPSLAFTNVDKVELHVAKITWEEDATTATVLANIILSLLLQTFLCYVSYGLANTTFCWGTICSSLALCQCGDSSTISIVLNSALIDTQKKKWEKMMKDSECKKKWSALFEFCQTAIHWPLVWRWADFAY